VRTTVQYGHGVVAGALYLHDYQLLPYARAVEAIRELFGCAVSAGTLSTAVRQDARRGKRAIDEIGILAQYRGTCVHDGVYFVKVPPTVRRQTWPALAHHCLLTFDLTFPPHVHRFDTFKRALRRLILLEALCGADFLFDAAVVLLNDIVQVLHSSECTIYQQYPFVLRGSKSFGVIFATCS
jgi:hypothetical protein